jgi:3-oxoacyl-[acyl-carrier-protein] synthase II
MVAGGSGNKINPTILSRSRAYELAPWSETPDRDPRPFDSDRRGTVIGEGAASFVLEEREYALARGAKPLAVVRSYAESVKPTATFGIQEEAAKTAIRLALERAGMNADEIGHVNANATGLPSDSAEARAIENQLGDVPVFSACGAFGNLGSGGGSVELVASLLALEKGLIPPTRNCDKVASDCPINVVTGAPQELGKPTFIKLNHANTGRSFALILEKC